MKIRAAFILITGVLSFALPAFAQNVAIIFGGEDNPTQVENQFQGSFTQLAGALHSNGWDVETLFDGSKSHCSGYGCSAAASWSLDPIAAAEGKDSSQVPPASKQALIGELDHAIQTLGPGDQLLIEVNTHGAPEYRHGKDGSVTDTVGLAVYDPQDPDGQMLIDDPELTRRYQQLKDKGVKLAFGNDSCFGGPAAQVLAPYGCVITGTDSSKYNLGSPVSDALADLLTANPKALSKVTLAQDGRVAMDDVFLDVLSRSWQGNHSPYYNLPFAGTMEPEFSAETGERKSDVNLSGWLRQVKSDYVNTQGGDATLSCPSADLEPLMDFTNQFVSPFLDQLNPDQSLAIARYYLNKDLTQDNTPTAPLAVAPADLVKNLANVDQDARTAETEFNNLSKQEQSLLTALGSSGLAVNLNLPPEIADSRPSLDQAVRSLNGKGIDVFPTSSSSSPEAAWLTAPVNYGDGTGSHTKEFFEPSSPFFHTSDLYLAQGLATEMAKTYPPAKDSAFVRKLASALDDAKKSAWNSASPGTRSALQSINQVEKLRNQEKEILESTKGEAYVLDNIEARMYSYIAHRKQAGATDPAVKNCEDFTLRRL